LVAEESARERTVTNLLWRKSSYSGVDACVEVALLDNKIVVRDSKCPDGSELTFTPGEWRAFVRGVRDGEFDPETR
jgi:hypothetical protein